MFNINEINLTEEEAKSIISRCSWCVDYVDMAEELADYGCVWDGDGADLYAKAYWTVHKRYAFGVCAGRHEMPVQEFVFGETVDPTRPVKLYNTAYDKIPEDAEHIDLYVTGLTPATLAIVAVCANRGISLTAYNYNRETGKYMPQEVLH